MTKIEVGQKVKLATQPEVIFVVTKITWINLMKYNFVA